MAIIDRIKFDGLVSRDWLVYKYPGESFVTTSQLIVGEGQMALFVKGGQVCDCFPAGTYTLSTPNLPILNKLVNLPFGGQTPFTAEIYFINKTTKLDLYWGTVDPIQVIDPKYHTMLRVRGFGQVGVKVADFRLFLTQMIGTLGGSEVVSFDKIISFFKALLMARIKTIIADAIVNRNISALEISAKLDEISDFGKARIEGEFMKFGVEVVNFFISSINFPDEDFEAINNILKDKAAFDLMGDGRYAAKRSYDVMETMAGNEGGAGASMGAGLGVGIGLAAASNMSGAMGKIASNINVQPQPAPQEAAQEACGNCGKPLVGGARFCSNCGQPVVVESPCPQCQASVKSTEKFCHSCGFDLTKKP